MHAGNPPSSKGSCYAIDSKYHYGTEWVCKDKTVLQQGDGITCEQKSPPSELVDCSFKS